MPAIDFEARRTWFAARHAELEAAGAKTIVLASHKGMLAGFVTVDPAEGYIDQLAVAPDAQRRGAAGRLLDEARRISPHRLALHVNQDNAPALQFYERQGFSVVRPGVNPSSGLAVWEMYWVPRDLSPPTAVGR